MVPANIYRAARRFLMAAVGCLITPFAAGADPSTPDAEQLAQRCLACHQASLDLSRFGKEELAGRIAAKRDDPTHGMMLGDADETLVKALSELLAGVAE